MVDDETGSVLVQVLGNFGVVADRIGHDDVAADGEILEMGGDVDGGTEVVETVVEGGLMASPMVLITTPPWSATVCLMMSKWDRTTPKAAASPIRR